MGARHHGPPRRGLVIEPFAGSACYSLRWEAPKVRLYDLSEDVCAVWDWLINCSEADVRAVPSSFTDSDQWRELPDGPRQAVFWNVKYAVTTLDRNLPEWYLLFCRTGERTGPLRKNDRYADGRFRDNQSQRCWGDRMKARIVEAKPLIADWTVECMSYEGIPLDEAHWFVDPPYQGPPGRAYAHSEIDFPRLGEWCRNLPGAVDVCENEGADWLPFEPLYTTHAASRGKKSTEVVWRRGMDDLWEG